MSVLAIPLPLPSGAPGPELPIGVETQWALLVLFLVLFAVSAAALVELTVASELRRLARPRLVTCPRTGLPARIKPSPFRSLLASLIGWVRPRVEDCTLWPRVPECRGECMRQG